MRSFSDLIDLKALEKLVVSNYRASKVPIGVIDAVSGEVYAAAGWQRICTEFHRKHPETNNRCIESDTHITGKINTGEVSAYKCKNGLWDIGIPIICENRHLATIFLGQFRYEDESLDKEMFIHQAQEYGFPTDRYLEALEEVPVFSREKVEAILEYNKALAAFLSSMVADKLNYKKEAEQRTKAVALHTGLFHRIAVGVVYQDKNGAITSANKASEEILGMSLDQMQGRKSMDPRWKAIRLDGSAYPGEEHPAMVALKTGRPVRDEIVGVHNPEDGENHWLLVNSIPEFEPGQAAPYQVFSSFVDITERINAEAQLNQANEALEARVEERTAQLTRNVTELETLFNNSQVGIMVLKGGRFLDRGNQRLADILGYDTPDEMAGFSMRKLHMTEASYIEFGERYYNRLLQKEMLQIEYRLRRKDGSPVWCMLSGKALDQNTPADLEKGVVWIVDDITDAIRNKTALLDVTRKLEMANKLAKSGWWEYDVKNDAVNWPVETYDLYGLNPHTTKMDYNRLMECIHPEFHEYHNEQLRRIYEDGEAEFLYPIFHPDGETHWLWAKGEADYDREGNPKRLFGTLQDITERIRIEETLRLQTQIIRQVHDSVISVDMAGNITSWNKGSELLFQYRAEEAIGQHVRLVYPEDYYSTLEEEVIPGLLASGSMELETDLLRKNGEVFHALISLSVLKDEKGEVYGMIGYTIDISQRKRVERELDRSNKELEQFAYVASHDLQEPLRAVVGFLQLLQARYRDQLDDKGIHYINRSVKAGHRMQKLITDLLKLSRVTTKAPKFVPVDLNRIISRIEDNLHSVIQEKAVDFRTTRLPEVTADEQQMERLFQNLIANAVKYNTSSKPFVEIGYETRGSSVEFYVKDNGIGIAPKFHDRIFQVFQRLHTRQEFSGTGIGLALCKKIVERHGGGIRVVSEPGRGSEFRLTIPMKKEK
ncbi:MAG: PAS domain S-box protein [Desulfobacterales bacterium]|nr:PAS domain S-box protein [Desulfobacterales bacterium]